MPLVFPHIAPGEKADAAHHDQPHHREVHQRIAHMPGERDIGRSGLCAHQVESGVAEGGDGVEHGVPDAPQPHLRAEPQGQQHGTSSLQQQHGRQDEPGPPDDPAHLGRRDGLLHHPALLQADPPARQHGNGHSHRHHAHAADLDQQNDHRLAESGPVQRRVLHHQAGDTGGGGCGEQRVKKGSPLPVPGGDGQRQQQRSGQDQQGKSDQDDPGRRHLMFSAKKHSDPSSNFNRSLCPFRQQAHYSMDAAMVLSRAAPIRLDFAKLFLSALRHAHCSTPPSPRLPVFCFSRCFSAGPCYNR